MNRFMLQLIVRRIGAGLLTLLIVSAVVFFITSLLPGDAAQLLLDKTPQPKPWRPCANSWGWIVRWRCVIACGCGACCMAISASHLPTIYRLPTWWRNVSPRL